MNDQANVSNGNRAQLIPAAQAVPAIPDSYGTVGLYPTGADTQEFFGLNLLEYWRILNKRKWLILGITLAVVAIGAVRTLMQTPLYTASIRLQIDRPTKIVQSGSDVIPEAPDYEFMETQYELLRSRMMAERV